MENGENTAKALFFSGGAAEMRVVYSNMYGDVKSTTWSRVPVNGALSLGGWNMYYISQGKFRERLTKAQVSHFCSLSKKKKKKKSDVR